MTNLKTRYLTIAGKGVGGSVLSLLAGCLFPLALSPFEISPVAILSLFVLQSCLQDVDTRAGTWRAYLFGLGMYGVGASWVYVSIHEFGGASVPLSIALVALFVGAIALISACQGYLYVRFFKHEYWGIVFGFAALWVGQEWFRTWFLSGFPWLFIGYGFLDTWLMNLAPVTGVFGVSFVAAVTASALYAALGMDALTGKNESRVQNDTPQQKSSLKRPWAALMSAMLIALIWLGSWSLSLMQWVTPRADGELSVSVVQGNVDQHVKWQRDMVIPILNLYRDLSASEWQSDIIVWPEAAITLLHERATVYLQQIAEQASATRTTVITGIPGRDPASGSYRNMAVALGNGSGTYQKRKLVPFGEYVPLESLLRGIIAFFDLPMSHNGPGPMQQEPIKAGPWRISTSICYEVVYGELVRGAVENPDLLLTISNDTWFGTSIGPLQHLQMARMRALENGRYLIRGTNNGVTAIVNEQGAVKASLPQFERGVLRSNVIVMQGSTPYSRWGTTPMLLVCALFLLVSFLRGRARRRRILRPTTHQ